MNVFDGLIPEDQIMAAAWIGSVEYALTQKEILAQYRADTGDNYEPAKNPLDKMIDEACGRDKASIQSFAKWHNQNIWGKEDGKPIDGRSA